MAEAIFQHLTADIDSIGTVDSAGVGSDFWLKPIDQRSVYALYSHGITRQTREPRRICARDFLDFDYILAMDRNTLFSIEQDRRKLPQAIEIEPVIEIFGSFSPEDVVEVRDPFFRGFEAFEATFQMLVRFSKAFLRSELRVDVDQPG